MKDRDRLIVSDQPNQRRGFLEAKNNVNNININLSIKNVNIIHNAQNDEEIRFQDNIKKTHKPKTKSLDRNFFHQSRTQFDPQSGIIQNINSQRNPLSRKMSRDILHSILLI